MKTFLNAWGCWLLAGNCRHRCEWVTLTANGKPDMIFIPECGCPVHDIWEYFPFNWAHYVWRLVNG